MPPKSVIQTHCVFGRRRQKGSHASSRKRGPRRTVHASFPRTRLEHSIKRRTDAGLAVLRKPFANGTLLIHLIAETRALNRGLPISLKLPRVESQMRACDNCTTRKSASFQIRAKLEPLCNPLQAALRFFRVLMPASSSVSLAGRLPRFITAKPWRRIGFTTFPFLPTRMNFSVSIRLAPVSPPAALVATCPYHREEQPATHLLV